MTETPEEVPTVAIAVKTMDRGAYAPKVPNCLGDTLANLKRGGVFRSPHLHSLTLVDSGSPDVVDFIRSELPEAVWTVEDGAVNVGGGMRFRIDAPVEGRRNLHRNARDAIQIAGSAGATWAMVIEDDIDVCSDFLESTVAWLADHRQPSPMMYAFGANYQQIRNLYRRSGSGVWKYGVRGFYGALCCVWSPEDALDVVEWYGPDPCYVNVETGRKIYGRGHDMMLGRWGADRDIKFFRATVPCFIQHIGVQSGLGNRKIEYAGWRGRGYSYVNGKGLKVNRP